MSVFLSASDLFFEYESSSEPLFAELSVQFSPGWTGVVGANGTGKSTLLKLLCGVLEPDAGTVRRSGMAVYCEQDAALPPSELPGLFGAYDSYSRRLVEGLRLEPDMVKRWGTLSWGERKKMQIACALFRHPEILCVDEPANHLDIEAKALLAGELGNFKGIGVLVSHDRELLDFLCAQNLFLESGRAIMRSGGIGEGMGQARSELVSLLGRRRQLKNELKRGKRELQRRREKEQRARSCDNKKKLDCHDHDGKSKIDAARVSGRDRRQGDLAGLQEKVVARAGEMLAGLGEVKIPRYSLKIPYGCYSSKNTLLELAERSIGLGADRRLLIPELRLEQRDRVALTGVNGSGKSTLLAVIAGELKLGRDEYLFMPQEFSPEMQAEIHEEMRGLSRGEFSLVMNVVASLGSRPERVLDSNKCSPGEWRKLFFGLGALRRISLIVMDEPTNHLDLPSVECLETALRACCSALLLVSHDLAFLRNTCDIHWHIGENADGVNTLLKGGTLQEAAIS
ncbi:MAG: ATP-binding cassette domain-containing protein [Victivallaceae bacterium]|nr:ATP-binding cassette domain-containing protein [Victivallaceae bacterium]